jgi:uncharacterized alkaline shock family protein YloU
MAPRTSNLYGKIAISKHAIEHVALAAAREAYGVASVMGVSVSTHENRIDVSVALDLKFGVTIDPVIESIRSAVKYNVENFTGMTVECVDIDILGIRN